MRMNNLKDDVIQEGGGSDAGKPYFHTLSHLNEIPPPQPLCSLFPWQQLLPVCLPVAMEEVPKWTRAQTELPVAHGQSSRLPNVESVVQFPASVVLC